MAPQRPASPVTVTAFARAKAQRRRLCLVTAYDYPTALLADRAGLDGILVGDSLGNVVLGYSSTLPVAMEEMLHHTRAVARAAKRAMVIGDMPFLSYQASLQEAVRNAGQFLKAGAVAVKLEGGLPVAATAAALVEWGIPVMGHIGFTPQSQHQFGTEKVRGKTLAQARRLLRDLRALEDAGCFAVVLECVPLQLAARLTEAARTPTIGIGSGPHCDGQVQVLHDILGMVPDQTFKHAKRYAELGQETADALKCYAQEVLEGTFPTVEHSFEAKDYQSLTLADLEGE